MRDAVPRPPLPGAAVVAADRRVRDSLASLLGATGRVDVVGAAGDAATAVRLAGASQPDIIVVDLQAAELDRAPLLERLRSQAPAARILVVEWDGRWRLGLPPGADGVLDVHAVPGALLDALLSVPPGSD